MYLGRIDDAEIKRFHFLMRSGQAVLFPMYQGNVRAPRNGVTGSSGERGRIIQHQDIKETLDWFDKHLGTTSK